MVSVWLLEPINFVLCSEHSAEFLCWLMSSAMGSGVLVGPVGPDGIPVRADLVICVCVA
jgi:hypothetical protein